MNRELLEHAITIMERVRDEDQPFNMVDWFGDWNSPYDCGTAACFAGWCARDPVMQKAGLYAHQGLVRFGATDGHFAISDLFGLSLDAARYLVLPGSYPFRPVKCISPDHVIARIRVLIENNSRFPGQETANA